MGKHELLIVTTLSSGTGVACFGRYVPRYRRYLALPYSAMKTETAGTKKPSSNGRGDHKSHTDYHVHISPATDPYLKLH